MRRIFILSSHPLFGQGVESLLRHEPGVEILGRETNVDKAIECIKELQPDAVILECPDPASDPTPAVMRILREGVGAKVIGLNLQDNKMFIKGMDKQVNRSAVSVPPVCHPGTLTLL